MKIYVVNRVLSGGETIVKDAFPSKELALNYQNWANKKFGPAPSWIEEIIYDNFDYSTL